MNPTTFSDSLNVSVTVIFNIIKGRRSKPSFELIHKILKTYDKLNAEWLIKGDGAMWNDDIVTTEKLVPANVNLEARIRELLLKTQLQYPESFDLMELDELVTYLMSESSAQKHKLVLMHERQEALISMLREKLRLVVK